MIIFILLFLLKLVIAFILWLVMAVGIQVALSGISKTHSSIDPYAIAIIWWTIIFMAGLASTLQFRQHPSLSWSYPCSVGSLSSGQESAPATCGIICNY